MTSAIDEAIIFVTFNLRFPPLVPRIVRLLVLLLIASHWSACVFYRVGINNADSPDSWVNRVFDGDAVADDDRGRRYMTSLYWAVTTLTTGTVLGGEEGGD